MQGSDGGSPRMLPAWTVTNANTWEAIFLPISLSSLRPIFSSTNVEASTTHNETLSACTGVAQSKR